MESFWKLIAVYLEFSPKVKYFMTGFMLNLFLNSKVLMIENNKSSLHKTFVEESFPDSELSSGRLNNYI
jgi:hypothetical protein